MQPLNIKLIAPQRKNPSLGVCELLMFIETGCQCIVNRLGVNELFMFIETHCQCIVHRLGVSELLIETGCQ